jgi:hypothetical protein
LADWHHVWDVSKITDFDSVFSGLRNPRAEDFSEDISNWDVSSQRDDHERTLHWSLLRLQEWRPNNLQCIQCD